MTMIKATTAEGRHDRGDGQRDGREDSLDEIRRSSLEHVHRSRKEPGSISHAVHRSQLDDRDL
jgi:quinol monooxygenase YgiN